MTSYSHLGKAGLILLFVLIIIPTTVVAVAPDANSVTVVVRDVQTHDSLTAAMIYLDGGYRGVTSGGTGKLVIQDISPGTHTLRVALQGYKEITQKFIYPAETTIQIMISKGYLVSLNPDGPKSHAINIVFYPSSTSYDSANHTKISDPVYIMDEARFRDDVMNVINNTYLNLDQFTSTTHPISGNYRNDFNFYYYYNPAAPADAFSGCAGSVPDSYWNDVTFSDATVILYPTYFGRYTDSASQPSGCTQDYGPGRRLMKAAADQEFLFRHETGHAAFGLVDAYYGDTYYYQNDPYPNVWTSLESCKADAKSNNRDPALCRQIAKENSPTSVSVKNFWHSDSSPDIMAYEYGGTFGDAATQRINYVLSRVGS